MAKTKKKKYSSFNLYTEHSIMRIVLLSMLVGVVGVVVGVLFLFVFAAKLIF